MCPWFGGWGGGWFGGGLIMMIMMVLFWGLILWGGFVLVKKLMQQSQDNRPVTLSQPALDILKQRYAKGEISRDEFERMKKEID